MAYGVASYGSAYFPKLLGTYEKEIAHLWREEYLRDFKTIIDAGCAEGYYLAGIGRLLARNGAISQPRLIGYDIDNMALKEAMRLFELNGVLNYELNNGTFGTNDDVYIPLPALLICDIEGAEREFLDPSKMRVLFNMHVLVEIHDEPGRTDTLDCITSRFLPSHCVTKYEFNDRAVEDFPNLIWPQVHCTLKLSLMEEHRKFGKRWLFMKPKNWTGFGQCSSS